MLRHRARAVHAVCHRWHAAQDGVWSDVEMVIGDQSDPASMKFVRWCADTTPAAATMMR